MKTKTHAGDTARIRIVAPTAALATGLVTPLALGGPGDLDPAFGRLGRVSELPKLDGPAWSLDVSFATSTRATRCRPASDMDLSASVPG